MLDLAVALDEHRAYRRDRYLERKCAGLCVDCGRLALPDNVRCERDRARHRRQVAASARRRRERARGAA